MDDSQAVVSSQDAEVPVADRVDGPSLLDHVSGLHPLKLNPLKLNPLQLHPLDPPRPPLRPLAEVMPPLLLGTATFNTQYVADPAQMPYRAIVRRALVDLDVRGFDTSPYYGPSEALLGEALEAATDSSTVPRSSYFLETKAGRVHSAGFDYTPAAVQASVRRSLQRLRTSYVDLVYAHDVEFVTAAEVMAAVRALRAMRTDGSEKGALRYVGISGYPVDVLAGLAEQILHETGEPIDAVLSYGHCTVQNEQLLRKLPVAVSGSSVSGSSVSDPSVSDPSVSTVSTSTSTSPLSRFHAAGVSVVLNASLLNMGLLTTRGVASGPLAAWHPSPPGLRLACQQAAAVCRQQLGLSLEHVALRYALDLWARTAADAGLGTKAVGQDPNTSSSTSTPSIGPSVLGVTSVDELTETVLEWWSVLDRLGIPHRSVPEDDTIATTTTTTTTTSDPLNITAFVHDHLWPVLGTWKDYAWQSPPADWTNQLTSQDAPNR